MTSQEMLVKAKRLRQTAEALLSSAKAEASDPNLMVRVVPALSVNLTERAVSILQQAERLEKAAPAVGWQEACRPFARLLRR